MEHFNSIAGEFTLKIEENKESTWDRALEMDTAIEKCLDRWEFEFITSHVNYNHCVCGAPCTLFVSLKVDAAIFV
jgi:hypothetical protein